MTSMRRGAWGLPIGLLLAQLGAGLLIAAPASAEAPLDAPVITSPVPGVSAAGHLSVSATTAADTTVVEFSLASVYVTAPVVDGVARAAISTYSLPNGVHELSAAGCNAEGCAPIGADIVDVQVGNPVLGVVGPLTFHPARRTLSFGFTLPAPSTAVMTVRNKAGVVRTTPAVTLPAGPGKLLWNGRDNAGAVVPHGTYIVRVTTTRTAPSGETLTAYLEKTVSIDLVAPALSSPAGAGTIFFPYADGYADVFRPAVTTNSAATLSVRIYTSANRYLRAVPVGSKPAGRWSAAWNGRLVNGTRVPDGTYKFRWVATDTAGNTSYSALYPVGINWRRAVLKKGTKTLTASASRTSSYVGSCSIVRTATDVAPGALELRSNGKEQDGVACNTAAAGFDIARTYNRWQLPNVTRVHSITVVARGGDQYSLGGVATLSVQAPAGGMLKTKLLSGPLASYSAPAVGANALDRYRYLRWRMDTRRGDSWTAHSFTVNYSWWVLV